MTALLDPDPAGDAPRPAATGRTAHAQRRSGGCSAASGRPAAPGRRVPRPPRQPGAATTSASSSPGSATRSSRRSSARPGSIRSPGCLPAPSDGEVVDERPTGPGAARVVERAGHGPPPRRDDAAAARSRHRDQAGGRDDGQRRRRRRCAPVRCATGSTPTTSCRASPIVAMVPMLVGGSDRDDAHVAGLVVPLPTNVADAGRAAAPHERRPRRGQAAPRRRAGVVDAGRVDVRPAGAVGARRPPRRRAAAPLARQPDRQPGDHQRARIAPADVPRRPPAGGEPPGADDQRAVAAAHRAAVRATTSIDVGAVACRDTLEDLDALVERMPVELDVLDARPSSPRRVDTTTTSRRDGGGRDEHHDGARPSPRAAAIFDLDRTLIGGPSAPVFSHSLDAAGITQRRIPGAGAVAATYRALGETALTAATARLAARATAGWSLRRSSARPPRRPPTS